MSQAATPVLEPTSVPVSPERTGRAPVAAAVVAILVTATWFRVIDLGRVPGVNGDEAWTGVQALRTLHGEPGSWRTPTGNPLNVFFWGPEVVLHALFVPSFVLLRSVAVVSGLIALALNYWLCRRVFDRPTALASTLVLAVLPITIAYSRFAWDSCQTPLMTVLVVYIALGIVRFTPTRAKWITAAIIASAAAIVVHPTNVFLLPFVAVSGWMGLMRGGNSRFKRTIRARWQGLLAAAIVVAVALGWMFFPLLAAAGQRLVSPGQFSQFVLDWGRLFSGATVYRYISGSIQSQSFDVLDAATWIAVLAGLYGYWCQWKSRRDPVDRALVFGYLLVLGSFYLVAGPRAIAPHYERYAMCLVVPGVLLLSRGALWWWRRAGMLGRVSRWSLTAILVALLADFYAMYFRAMEISGGDSHLAFRTAAVEPKQQAFEQIIAAREPNKPLWIVSDNWWIYWPLAYLSFGEQDVHVVHNNELPARGEHSEIDLWYVELTGSKDEARLLERLAGTRFGTATTGDARNRPVVTLVHPSSQHP